MKENVVPGIAAHSIDIGREYYEGNAKRIVSVIHNTLQAEEDVSPHSEELPPCPPLDPMLALADFISTHRATLSNSVQKSTELYQHYLTSPSSVRISHKRFTSALREMYGVSIEPRHFDDGMHQGLKFPNLVGGFKTPQRDVLCNL